MIRVLQVIGGLNRGGAETMIINLYRAVNHDEIQFDFIIHDERQNAYIDEIKSMGGRVFTFPKFTGKNIVSYRKHWHDFLVEHSEYRIVHSHVRSYAVVFFPVAKKLGLTTIVHSHSTSNGSGVKGKIKNFMQLPLRWQADYLFGCSEISGKWLFGNSAVKKENYYTIKNAIDVERYRFNEVIRNQMRENLGVNGLRVYGHVGRLSEPKNHMFLLDVFKEIHKRDEKTVLLIAGSGELKSLIEKKIRDEGLFDCVRMLGARNDIPELMQAMDVFLFPSLWEGLPVTVVEAQAAGLPCYVSDTVTKEVHLSEAVQYLPITDGTDVWADRTINVCERYPNAADDVIKNGFDIHATANWITEFYRSIVNE